MAGRAFPSDDRRGAEVRRSMAPDGATKLSVGSWSSSGASEIEGDFLCTPWDTDIVKNCVAILRNPERPP
jgi:hypothetical protein